jgi:hypothetical protein
MVIIIADTIIIGGGTTAGIITAIGIASSGATALRNMLPQGRITPFRHPVDILCCSLCHAALLGVSGIYGGPNIR